ncbi:Mu transposase C-terminal domain-containing protein [Terasakiella sp. A23]|uniref:Mu transposase C-terminal domain-containing protein n=1 Tax=Terasakiella sp. FCG-A23 TaxID=3080561 RepID=UPI0029546873|nr:Mu transposase C-terminal domain-containing protein [Terasakiella sp. A23]MDV7341007.1 Mu transposase C-terminal domain-containing protein [Terasakiella sp. A23]
MAAPFFSADEYAAMDLPDFYNNKRGVIRHAQREGWIIKDRWNRWQPSLDKNGIPLAQKRSGKGGGWEYHYVLLPPVAFNHFIDNHLQEDVEGGALVEEVDVAFKEKPDQLDQLNQWQVDVMEARCGILRWIDEQSMRGGRTNAIERLRDLILTNRLPSYLRDLIIQANAKSGKQSGKTKLKLSRATIYEWFKAKEKNGVAGLAPALSKETDFTIPDWAWQLLELYRQPNKPSLLSCMEDLPKYLPANIQVPTYDQARLFIKKLSPITQNKGRMGPQALKAMKAFTRRDVSELWPTAVYSSDGHTFKATVEHPFHGQPFRPEITVVIDIYTRYVVGWSVGLAEDSLGVLEALSVSIIEGDDGRHRGMCCIWYTDNGPGFRAELFEAPAVGFYDRWGITPKKSLAYNSQARGVIERLNKTLWVPLAKSYTTYVGKDADKEAIREIKRITDKELRAKRKAPFEMTWDEFKQCVQDQIDSYNAKPHSSLKRVRCPETRRNRYLSPKEVWDNWLAEGNQPILIAKDEAADLKRPYLKRKISRGEVRLLNNVYFSFDLEHYHGDWALVGFDVHDATKVWVRDFDMRLLAVAELDGNKRAYFDQGTMHEALSFQQKKEEQRTKGRLKRLDDKRAEVIAESQRPLEIEYQETEQAPILTLDAQERAEAELAKMQKTNEPVKMVSSTGRPIFSDDVSWGKWLSENPTHATDTDVEELQRKLKNDIFRMQMEFEGVVLDTLREIAAKRAAV